VRSSSLHLATTEQEYEKYCSMACTIDPKESVIFWLPNQIIPSKFTLMLDIPLGIRRSDLHDLPRRPFERFYMNIIGYEWDAGSRIVVLGVYVANYAYPAIACDSRQLAKRLDQVRLMAKRSRGDSDVELLTHKR
jgi:hypothetical protein